MFAVFGLVFDGFARVWPRVFVRRFGVFVLAGLIAFAVLFLFYPHLHKYAAMTLANGPSITGSGYRIVDGPLPSSALLVPWQ